MFVSWSNFEKSDAGLIKNLNVFLFSTTNAESNTWILDPL